LENKIGSLEPNKYADIVIMNLRSVSFAPTNYVPSQIVYCGNSRDIDTVLVNGDIVLEKGQLTNANEDNVITAAQAASDRLIENAGLGNLRKHSWSV
ncbi:MAG: amidohydrolase family protein, partial [Candidatus Ranarchaeia archaeon]